MLTEFDTALVGSRDKLDSWRAAVSTDLVEVGCRIPRSVDFAGAFSVLRCGERGTATLKGSHHVAFRDKSCVKRTGEDFFLLFLQRVGKMLALVEENTFEILLGDFFFYDASVRHQPACPEISLGSNCRGNSKCERFVGGDTHSGRVTQMVGFGVGTPKRLYLSMGID